MRYFTKVLSVCLVCICVVAGTCFAQNGEERIFQRLSHTDGLSNDEVFCLTQDRHGLMWFGTADGLNCYDGTKFTVYRHREGDTTTLPQNGITCIAEDKAGNLWVGTQDYMCRFYPARGTFVSYRMQTQMPFIYVRNILDDGKNTFYVTIGKGLFAVDKQHFKAEQVIDNQALGEKVLSASRAICDADGNVWMMTAQGLFVYHPAQKKLRHVNRISILSAMPETDNEGRFWFADVQNIYCFDPRTERVTTTFSKSIFHLPIELSKLSGGYLLCQSQDGLLWFQLNQMIFTLNPNTGAVVDLTKAVRNELNSSELVYGFTDRTGVVWFGDNVRGVARWSPYKPKFRLWRHNRMNPNSLSDDYIRGVWEDSSANAWVCTQYGGLNRVSRLTGDVHRYPHSSSSSGLSSYYLWGIVPGGKDKIWLYKDNSSQELNTTTGRFRPLPIHPVSVLFQDRDGVFWTVDTLALKGQTSLGMVSADGMRFLPVRMLSSNASRLDAAVHDRRGRLWFGMYVACILRHDKTRRTWDTLGLTPPIRRADAFSAMLEDRAGNVWITTKGDGIYVCDTNDRVTNITEKDGLPNNNVYGIFEDKHGMIWMSCDKGVVVYHPTTKKFRLYTPNDGLQSWEFNRMAFHQTKQGYIYFGGTDGLNLFHPDSLRDNPHPPLVRMSAIAVMGKPLQHDTVIGDIRVLTVPHDHKTLGFEFAALDFTAPELNRYSWKLDGFDRDWSEPSPKHETKYTNLSPGDYVFRVKACNNDGVWNENGIVLFITIQPAWYQRWWFWLVCGLALIGSVVMIVRVRVRAVEVQNRLLEVEVHKRTKELREANGEIKRQLEIQDVQSREIELANTELDATLQSLKSTQTQLVQSERMNAIGMLTAGVMHEINNPNAITYAAISQTRTKLREMTAYFLSLLDEETKDSDEVRKFEVLGRDAAEHLELAASGAQRVKAIVGNLQGFTKYQEDTGKTGDLAHELRSTVELFRLQFKEVTLELRLPDSLPFVGNFGELNQVFLNLLVNAAQAGATTLTLTAEMVGEHVVIIRFADNGGGMPEAVQKKIFEPFFSTKSKGNSGLGLSISKHIVEQHHGTIRCESELGKGTTFILELPRQAGA